MDLPSQEALASLDTQNLQKLIERAHTVLVQRSAPDAARRLSAADSWVGAILISLNSRSTPAYFLASLPRPKATAVYNACLIADHFLEGLGDWTPSQFSRLQILSITAICETLKARGQNPKDAEHVALSLRGIEEAFNHEYPGMIEGNLVSFLASTGDE